MILIISLSLIFSIVEGFMKSWGAIASPAPPPEPASIPVYTRVLLLLISIYLNHALTRDLKVPIFTLALKEKWQEQECNRYIRSAAMLALCILI